MSRDLIDMGIEFQIFGAIAVELLYPNAAPLVAQTYPLIYKPINQLTRSIFQSPSYIKLSMNNAALKSLRIQYITNANKVVNLQSNPQFFVT